MPVSIADLTRLRSHPHYVTPYMSALTPAIMFTGVVNGAHDKNARVITVTTVTGDLADCVPGMTVIVTRTGSSILHKRRLVDTDVNEVTVDENGISWQNGDFITILEDYELWSVFPYVGFDLDGTPIFYKDRTIIYAGQNYEPSPVAIIKGERCFILDTVPVTLEWTGDESYAIAVGATIASYQWSLSRGGSTYGSVVGSTDTTDTFQVTISGITGAESLGLWLALTVTDSNGNTQTTRRLVFIHTRTGDYAPYSDLTLSNLSGNWDSGGWKCSVTLHGDVTIEKNAHVILWHEAVFGYAELQEAIPQYLQLRNYVYNATEILMEGRVCIENPEHSTEYVTQTKLEILDVVAQLKKRRMFSISLNDSDVPSYWYEYYNLTVARALHHLYKWHSTLLDVVNVFLPIDNTVRLLAVEDFSAGNLYSMGDTFARNNSIFAHIVANKQGEIYCEIEYNMLNDTDRALMETAMMLLDIDLTGDPVWTFKRILEERVWIVQGSGIAYDGATSTPLMSAAPSESPEAMGEVELTLDRLALIDQDDLNEKTGRVYAVLSNDIEAPQTNLVGNYTFMDLVPQRVYSTIISEDQTGREELQLNCVLRDIRIGCNQRDGIVDVSIELETEAESYLGDTVDVPEPPPPAEPPPTEPPTYPTPTGPIPGDGFGTVYVATSGKLGRTRAFSAASPTWSDITPGGVSVVYDYILDPWDPYKRGYLSTLSGVYKSEDLDQAVPTWTLKLSKAAIEAACGGTYINGMKIIASRNVEDYAILFFRNDSNSNVCCMYSYDGGDSWNYSTVYASSGRIWLGGADYVPYLIDGQIVLYCVVTAGSTSYVRKSVDGGASWTTAISYSDSSLNHMQAVSVHCPAAADNEDGSKLYWVTVDNQGTTWRFSSYYSLDISSSVNTIVQTSMAYPNARAAKRTALETWTQDSQLVTYWYGAVSPTELYVSTNGGSSFSLKAATGLSGDVRACGGFPYNGEQYYAVTESGIFVSIDGGDTFADKTGDYVANVGVLSGDSGQCVVVPLWLAE